MLLCPSFRITWHFTEQVSLVLFIEGTDKFYHTESSVTITSLENVLNNQTKSNIVIHKAAQKCAKNRCLRHSC